MPRGKRVQKNSLIGCFFVVNVESPVITKTGIGSFEEMRALILRGQKRCNTLYKT